MTIVYTRAAPDPEESPAPAGGPIQAGGARCVSCGDLIRGEPVMRDNRLYCCDGCAGGGPCIC